MDKSFIEKIVNLAEPNIIEKEGYTYSDKGLNVIIQPKVEPVAFHTLRGMVETLKSEFAKFNCPVLVSVENYNSVVVRSAINPHDRERETPYICTAETPTFQYDRFISYEAMMIALKSKFVETISLLELVQLIGSIVEENNTAISDDGFSQSVVVRKGIALKDNKVINPRVFLTPYRTFIEVGQPASEFLVRLQDGGSVALFEADGGAWKLEARNNIAEYIKTELSALIEDGKVIVVE